jgi:hypothetical protein
VLTLLGMGSASGGTNEAKSKLLQFPQLETIHLVPTLLGIEEYHRADLKEKATNQYPGNMMLIDALVDDDLLEFLCVSRTIPNLTGIKWPSNVELVLNEIRLPRLIPPSLHKIVIGSMKHELVNKDFGCLKSSNLRSLKIKSTCNDCHDGNTNLTAEFLSYLPQSLETLSLMCFPSLNLPTYPGAKCFFPPNLKKLDLFGVSLTNMKLGPLPVGLTHLDLFVPINADTEQIIETIDTCGEFPTTLLEFRTNSEIAIIGALPPQCNLVVGSGVGIWGSSYYYY